MRECKCERDVSFFRTDCASKRRSLLTSPPRDFSSGEHAQLTAVRVGRKRYAWCSTRAVHGGKWKDRGSFVFGNNLALHNNYMTNKGRQNARQSQLHGTIFSLIFVKASFECVGQRGCGQDMVIQVLKRTQTDRPTQAMSYSSAHFIMYYVAFRPRIFSRACTSLSNVHLLG